MENLLARPAVPAATTSKKLVWTGRVLTGLTVVFLVVDALMKLVLVAPVIEASARLGLDAETARRLGVVLLASTFLHLVPRTQVLGALLLTAYLGGATATHVRIGDPFYFPVIMGIVLWAGLLLRHPRLRALVGVPANTR
jgi:hypothetical protein